MRPIMFLLILLPLSFVASAQEISDFHKVFHVERAKRFPFCGKLHLSQNYPNPLKQEETSFINYRAIDAAFAAILVYDSVGEIKLFQTVNPGVGEFEIHGAKWKPGEYRYTLVVNGRRVFTKKFTVLPSLL